MSQLIIFDGENDEENDCFLRQFLPSKKWAKEKETTSEEEEEKKLERVGKERVGGGIGYRR